MVKIENDPLDREYNSVAEALERSRVVKVVPRKDGKFCVVEMCDECFCVCLTQDQLFRWAGELMILAMSDPAVENDNHGRIAQIP